MYKCFPVIAALVLIGCQSDVERAEVADDAFCRKTVVERNDARPTAYQECRARLMQYHQQGAVAASGSTVIVNR